MAARPKRKTLPCKDKLTIARVPFALDKAVSGVTVSVKLPDGRTLTDPNVVVDDVFLVALGDSFASGESNPDRPVTFSAMREMVYDPTMQREEQQASRKPKAKPNFELASGVREARSENPAQAPHGGRGARRIAARRRRASFSRPSSSAPRNG